MGNRITWKNRPRSEYPWPLRTKRVTTVEFAAISGVGGVNFIGPLNAHAVVELLYRVSKLQMVGSFTDLLGFTVNMDVVFTIDGISDELQRFGDCAYHFDGNETYAQPFIDSVVSDPFTEDAFVEPITTESYGVSADCTGFDIIHVTDAVDDNKYHLNGVIYWLSGPPILIVRNREDDPLDTSDEVFNASLVLASGTFPIPLIADWEGSRTPDSSSMTITATEWFPFKTTAGDPAWNAATGLPVNGGPGA